MMSDRDSPTTVSSPLPSPSKESTFNFNSPFGSPELNNGTSESNPPVPVQSVQLFDQSLKSVLQQSLAPIITNQEKVRFNAEITRAPEMQVNHGFCLFLKVAFKVKLFLTFFLKFV